VRAGEVSASAVLESCLARTRQVEPLVTAYLARCDEEAGRRAAEIDRRRESGEPLGPLAGVPVALKDNLALAGTPLTCGSRVLGNYLSPYSATVVERLLDAGAVVLGKTNLDEFAMGSSCENSAFHPTRNPWHLGMVPGGSSGGSAAAVAAGSVPLALGSDTGGSIRQPAALCGVVGLKPSYGRVSRYGLVAFASSLDQIGPLTRTVGDAALALSVIAGGDERDSTCDPRPGEDYAAEIENGIEGWRVGVAREIDISGLSADSRRDWLACRQRLESLGARLVDVSVPNLPAAIAIYYVIANCEASANLARFDGVRYGRRAAASDLLSLYLASRSEGFGDEVKRRIMLGTFALSSGYYEAYYGRARRVLAGLTAQLLAAFEGCDLLASPTSPTGAFALGEKLNDPLTMYLNDIFTVPASLAGLPAVSVPSGMDDRGLPLALQLVGRPFGEARLLRAARAFETTAGEQPRPAFAGPPKGRETGAP
jgi:aspartyl-tRNA(Asn)/glutamyl-tRNA(Gln) amidotransferase subunit A